MEAPPGGSPASPAEAEAVILGTQKGMTAPPTLSLLSDNGQCNSVALPTKGDGADELPFRAMHDR